jgi:murein DD-endopeptidase MepM/ murein hydrolase activator NlpD
VSTKGQLFTAKLPSGKPHNALDMGTGGNAVLAAAAGTVTASRASGDARGNIIHINHGNGWATRYYHLDSMLVNRGATVAAGQQIGVVGRTGLPKNNPHLHFMVYFGGAPVDPQVVLPPRDSGGEVVLLPGQPTTGLWAEAEALFATDDPGTDMGEGGSGMTLALASAGLTWLLLR